MIPTDDSHKDYLHDPDLEERERHAPFFRIQLCYGSRLSQPKKEHVLEPPRLRRMNNNDADDFVAIDFETMTGCHTSACALGMVKVIDGEIVQRFYTLINPIRDEMTDREPCRRVHGISLSTVEKVSPFDGLFETIREFIDGLPLVCHNAGFDISVLNAVLDWYGLTGLIDTSTHKCTYRETGKSLKECCKEFGIPLPRHHDALCDAEACAKVYLYLIGKPYFEPRGYSTPISAPAIQARKIEKGHLVKLEDEQVANKNTIFYNARVVITGTFEEYPSRDELAAKLQALGAKIGSSISKKTSILVAGNGAGPSKLSRVRELQEQGREIRIVQAHELTALMIGTTDLKAVTEQQNAEEDW